MVADGGLGQSGDSFEVADAALAVGEQVEKAQSGCVCQEGQGLNRSRNARGIVVPELGVSFRGVGHHNISTWCRRRINRRCLLHRGGGARFAAELRRVRSAGQSEANSYEDDSMKTDAGQDVLQVLNRGIVVAGEVQVKLLGLQVLPVKVNLLISSVERAEELGLSWWNKQRQSETARPPHGGVPVPRNGKRHPRP